MQLRPGRILTAIVVGVLVSACGSSAHQAARTTDTKRTATVPTATVPKATPAQVRAQDRETPAQRAKQLQASRSRPLLGKLPLQFGDTTIDIGGLAQDGVRTRIVMRVRDRSHADARRLWSDVLLAFGDHASNYELELDQ